MEGEEVGGLLPCWCKLVLALILVPVLLYKAELESVVRFGYILVSVLAEAYALLGHGSGAESD